jgi:hypothetical protein
MSVAIRLRSDFSRLTPPWLKKYTGAFVATVVFIEDAASFCELYQSKPALCRVDEKALSGEAPNKATMATAIETKPINDRKDRNWVILNNENFWQQLLSY